jgi:MFS family permease
MVAFHVKPYFHFCIIAVVIIIADLLSNKYLVDGAITGDTSEKRKFFSKPEGVLVQLGIIAFCSMSSEGAMFDWSGVYFQDVVKAQGELVTFGYVIFMATMATGRFLGDKLVARIGKKKLLQISGLLTSCGLFLSVIFPYIVPATIGFLLVGFGVSSVIPITYSLGGRLTKVSPSIAIATIASVGYLGFLMGPPMIGYIAHVAGLRYSYALIGIFGFCIAFIVTKLKVVEK